jgi:hypothetical protein
MDYSGSFTRLRLFAMGDETSEGAFFQLKRSHFMRRFCFLPIILVLCSAAAFAQGGAKKSAAPRFSSVYTNFDKDCRDAVPESKMNPGTDVPGTCKGYGGYRVALDYSAMATSIVVVRGRNRDESISLGMMSISAPEKGSKLEWRLANGKPFAVIFRMPKYGEQGDSSDPFANKIGETLIIKGLKGHESIDLEVDVKTTPNPNEKARQLADSNYK